MLYIRYYIICQRRSHIEFYWGGPFLKLLKTLQNIEKNLIVLLRLYYKDERSAKKEKYRQRIMSRQFFKFILPDLNRVVIITYYNMSCIYIDMWQIGHAQSYTVQVIA